MNSEKEAAELIPAPKTGIRLVLWFGIYLAAQVPMIWHLESDYNPFNVFFFPLSLGMVVAIPLNMMPEAVSVVAAYVVLPLGFIAGYVVYPFHLAATLRARTRRRFSFLLLELVTVVLMNQSINWSMMNVMRG